jgi:hypothetical protein
MAPDPDPAELVGRTADERLFSDQRGALPAEIPRPDPIPPYRARARIVGAGATLTGVTLFAGIALIAVALIAAISSGIDALAAGALVLGAALIGTHWGWVHVAEISANALQTRHSRRFMAGHREWLDSIKPFTRYEVTTGVEEDGSISIVRLRYTPVPSGERKFTFEREVELRELHAPDDPGAAVAERAELLRRQAARDTARERERFEVAADAYETALLGRGDDEQRRAARRAASRALSEQINTNLRDPPLVE